MYSKIEAGDAAFKEITVFASGVHSPKTEKKGVGGGSGGGGGVDRTETDDLTR